MTIGGTMRSPRLGTVSAALLLVGILVPAPALAAPTIPQTGPVFDAAQRLHFEAQEQAAAIADVTGDGRNDVLATTGFSWGANATSLILLPQKADGSLANAVIFALHRGDADPMRTTMPLVAGDINDDGKTDAIVASGGGLDVFLQSGGTLAPATLIPDTTYAVEVEVGDFTGDGVDDLVLYRDPTQTGDGADDPNDGELMLLENTAKGAAWTPTVLHSGDLTSPWAAEMETGDVNGDGRQDLVAVNGANGLLILFGEPGGGFSSGMNVPSQGMALAIADLNGDGRDDVALGYPKTYGSGLNVLYQQSDGTLGSPVAIEWNRAPWTQLDAADVDGDGLADLVGMYWNTGGVNLLQQFPGTGLESAGCSYPAAFLGSVYFPGIAVGDVNGDGLQDIVGASSDGLDIFRQRAPDGTQEAEVEFWPVVLQPSVGSMGQFEGRFSLSLGGRVAGQTLTVTRGSTVVGTTSSTTATGRFTFETPLDATGSFVYRASWAGDAGRAYSLSGDASIQVQPLHASVFTLTVSPAVPTAGVPAAFTVHMEGFHNPAADSITIYGIPDRGSIEAVATGTVNPTTGDFVANVSPDRETVYWARYSGDDWYIPRETDHSVVKVKMGIYSDMLRAYRTDGIYHLYRAGKPAVYLTWIVPAHKKRVRVSLQRADGKDWRSAGHQMFGTDANGELSVLLATKGLPKGMRLRMKTRSTGDGDHLGNVSEWTYFKIT